jgi:hypothetical protein
MMQRFVFWPLALLLGVLGIAADGADDEGKQPTFVAHTAKGTDVRGPLRELKPDGSLRLGEGDGTRLGAGEVLTLRCAGAHLPAPPVEDCLILVNGDCLPIQSVRLADERLHFRHPDLADGKDTSLPLTAVAMLWRTAPDRADDPDRLRRRLLAGPRRQDVVLLRNGDTIAGTLNTMDQTRAEVEVEKRTVTVKMPQVAAIALSTELADTLRPKGAHVRVTLTDVEPGKGARLSLTSPSSDGSTLSGKTLFGAALRVPLTRVAAVDFYHGRAVYLSDLKPKKYEHRPYLDESWPFANDGNVIGHDLLLAGSTYARGIGLHSQSRLTYDLGTGYRRFEALVGLDDRDGQHGSVRVRLLADGKPLPAGLDGELTARRGPVPVSVPVEGGKELTLEVDFGQNGNVQDVVDWADARLVK